VIGVKPLDLQRLTCSWLAKGINASQHPFVYAFAAEYSRHFHYAERTTLSRTADLLTGLLDYLQADELIAYRGDQDAQPLRRTMFYPGRLSNVPDRDMYNPVMRLIPRRSFSGALRLSREAFPQALPILMELSSRYCQPENEYHLRIPNRPILFRLCHHNDVHVFIDSQEVATGISAWLASSSGNMIDFS
jgi:hypothetical protein